ncbi:MAG: ribonuclease HII [Spirochaetaceae bacterium]|nr:MAG: ribonuclease HII [Spirochaetaceae bacterium]
METICGIDEAGRGPLAGPVTAAAVVFGSDGPGCAVADSKRLSPGARADREICIRRTCVWGIGWAWPSEIDAVNIHHATLLAMQRAFAALCRAHEQFAGSHQLELTVLVDGAFVPTLPVPCRSVVGGDRLVPQISAASILAKEARDRWMRCYHREEPQFGFDRHMGYPTELHRQMISRYGVSRIHRHSFASPACQNEAAITR